METPPKKRPRHYLYDESVDEPGQLLEQENVEIEREIPSEDTKPPSKVSNRKIATWLSSKNETCRAAEMARI